MVSDYIPSPINTENVKLAPELQSLVELLAENAHDLWALQRICQGWTHGSARCDVSLKHPCLIPYSDLAENEKEFDRQTAMGTIKAIVALGFRISPLD